MSINENERKFDSKAFRKGEQSRIIGESFPSPPTHFNLTNPYTEGSWQHKSYNAGWCDRDATISEKPIE